jgi:cation:H+ antiporter
MVWLEFFFCAALILFSGSRLARYGDMIAEKTGLGRTWIGLILIATVTSLPELATGLSAVGLADAPDIAAGDVFGSCVFNLMLIGLIDLLFRAEPLLSRVDQGHILSASFGVLLIGVAAWGILLGTERVSSWPFWFGPSTLVILALYAAAMRVIFQFERRRMAGIVQVGEAPVDRYKDAVMGEIYRNGALHAAVIVGAGIWLPFIGSRIAEATGWGGTFVGNLLVAASTSLPEIVTSVAAVRLLAPDLAIANLFGSNLFNMAILAIDDIAYAKGPLLFDVSFYHLYSAVAALMMTGIGISGLIYRGQKRRWSAVTWYGAALLAIYLLNAYLLFTITRGNIHG